MTDYTVETERLRLRRPQESDGSAIEPLINDYDIANASVTIPYPYPDGEAELYLNRAQVMWDDEDRYSFIITDKETDAVMGLIFLHINHHDNSAEVGYWLGRPFWGGGYMTEALKAMLQFGFEELNLNRIQASYFSDNLASERVMEKVGMIHEGTFRQAGRKWGKYKDVSYRAILRDEFGR